MKRKYEPKSYSSQGNLDSDTELVSWISDGMQKLSRYMQMEECEGVMQYKETFYTYFQRKYGACSYDSTAPIISSSPPNPHHPPSPSDYPKPYWGCGQNPLWRTCVVQRLLNLHKKIKWNHITTYNIFYFSVCQLPLINEELYGQYCYLMFSPNKTARQIIEKSHENRRQIFL